MSTSNWRPSLIDVLLRGTPEPPAPYRQEMLGIMYARFHSYKPAIALMTVLTAALAFSVLSLHGANLLTLVWFGMLIAFSSLMLKSGVRKLGFDPRNVRSGRFVRRAERAAFLLGLTWSSVCFIQPDQSTVAQVVLIALTMGMACGAVLFTAPLVGVGVRYMQSTLVVILVAAALWNNEWVFVISGFGLALSAGLCVSAMSLYQSTYDFVTSAHEARKMAALLGQSLENATYGFAIFGANGALLASNSYHREYFADQEKSAFKIGRSEVRIDRDCWLVRDVRTLPDGNLMVSHTDISQQKDVERNLQDLHDEIHQTERARTEFISKASSSIEKPARFIRALSSAFSMESRIEFKAEDRIRLAGQLEQEADNLISMVQTLRNSVLAYSAASEAQSWSATKLLREATSALDCEIDFEAGADAIDGGLQADLFKAAAGASARWVLGEQAAQVTVSGKTTSANKLEIEFRATRPGGTPALMGDLGPAVAVLPRLPIEKDGPAEAVHELWLALKSDDISFELCEGARVIRVVLSASTPPVSWNRTSGAIELRA